MKKRILIVLCFLAMFKGAISAEAIQPVFLYPTYTEVFTNIATLPFSITCLATDLDIPPLPLTFALANGPMNMTVSGAGLLNWTPSEVQGPTTYGPATNTILVSVSNGDYAVTNSFTIIVMGTNLPPVFVTQNPPDQAVVVPDGSFIFTNAAINPNRPNNPLTYSLLYPPAGATIDSNGVIMWNASSALAGYNFLFTTVATDTDPYALNATSLSVTNSFLAFVQSGIVVGPPNRNTVPPGTINWIAVSVPTNAVAATNTLLFATNQPVNVWFSPNVPPNITAPNDYELLTNSSQGVGVLTTNSIPTIVLGGVYFLGVQNTNTVSVGYALSLNFQLATATNPVSVNYFPAFPGAFGAGGGAAGAGHAGTASTVYHVTTNGDAGPGTLRDAVGGINRTVVFDLSGTINLLSPLVITNSYLTLAGQTAPGGGITVVGNLTAVTNAHDVIIRDIRFRPTAASVGPTIVWQNGFEGYPDTIGNVVDYEDGWQIDSGDIDILTTGSFGSTAFQGIDYIDLNGDEPGEISTNIPTISGWTYTLNFAYACNPNNSPANATADVSINGTVITNVVAVCSSADTWSTLTWQVFTVSFTATSGSALLDFKGTSPGYNGVLLDAVSLTAVPPSVVWQNGFDGYTNYVDVGTGGYIDGWSVDYGDVEVRPAAQSFGSEPYQGEDYIDLNGNNPGTISTNIPTVAGEEYTLGFAYARNPNSVIAGVVPQAAIYINSNYLNTVTASIPNTWTPLDWQLAAYTFTATSASTLLTFASTNTPGASGVLLDAISLTKDIGAADALRFQNVSNVIADHISAEWSPSNLISVLSSSNVTVQWSVLSDSLYNPANPDGFGSLLRYGSGDLSFHHNLYADNYNGSPRLGDNLSLDFVDNVIYDWGANSGFSSNDIADNPGGFTNSLNYVCNYLIAGTNSPTNSTIAFWGGSPTTWIFQSNDFIDSNTNGIMDGANTQWAMFANQFTEIRNPFPLSPVPTDEAYLAYEKVLDFAGVDLDKRDAVDTNIVYKVRTQTGTLINAPTISPVVNTMHPYLDTDQDGIPDFWEITFGEPPYVPSNNNASTNSLGYTTLEEYNNWLAGPHALTVTTNTVDVDLHQMFGGNGNLSFFVTNGVHGTVYSTNVLAGMATNSGPLGNTVAVFTATNNPGGATNYSGYASFDVYVTNNDTLASFGPVTVSVVASAVPITTNNDLPPAVNVLTNAVLHANTNAGGSDFYEFTVGTNVYGNTPAFVSFTVTNASGPVILVARNGLPLPSLSSYDYLSSNSWTTGENILISPNSAPVALTNGNWYLAVVNVAGSNISYRVESTELFSVLAPVFLFPTNTDTFTNIEAYPFSTTCSALDLNHPTLPLSFALVSGPTNLTVSAAGLISWTPTEAQGPTTNGPATNAILVSVSNGDYVVTNSFTIIVVATNLPPLFVSPNPPNQVVIVPDGALVVTNSAVNLNVPYYPLTYGLLNPLTGAAIDSNGVITWTAPSGLVGYDFLFTTVATDTDPWAVNATTLSVTNSFLVYVESGIVAGTPNTNSVTVHGINWLAVSVPANGAAATNALIFATNQPVNVWFSTNLPPTVTNPGDHDLLTNSTHGISVLTTNSTPLLVPGGVYFLGVQNTNSVSVGYALSVDFQLAAAPSPVPISGIISTNSGGSNGFQLTWSAPTNENFQVQWTTNLVPPIAWTVFPSVIFSTNGIFIFTDSNAPRMMRFYELKLVP